MSTASFSLAYNTQYNLDLRYSGFFNRSISAQKSEPMKVGILRPHIRPMSVNGGVSFVHVPAMLFMGDTHALEYPFSVWAWNQSNDRLSSMTFGQAYAEYKEACETITYKDFLANFSSDRTPIMPNIYGESGAICWGGVHKTDDPIKDYLKSNGNGDLTNRLSGSHISQFSYTPGMEVPDPPYHKENRKVNESLMKFLTVQKLDEVGSDPMTIKLRSIF